MSYHLVALTQILNLIVYHLFEFGLLRKKVFFIHISPAPNDGYDGWEKAEVGLLSLFAVVRPLRRGNRHGQCPLGSAQCLFNRQHCRLTICFFLV